jgi:hypothetical protein
MTMVRLGRTGLDVFPDLSRRQRVRLDGRQ